MKVLHKYYPLIPVVGMAIYIVVFIIAAIEYPGGSENVPMAIGYSFFHNFLCDAMNEVTHGGLLNPARSLAIKSHLILSATMISFFFVLPEIFDWKNRNTQLIRYVGMLTMTVFIFMYTSYHDHIVTATGVLGTFALIPFFIEMRKYPGGGLKTLAYTCFALSIIVFFIFETKIGYYYLPFLQKITFFFDAYWVIWVSLIVYKKH
ncbi:MAG: hypothetical protein WBA74_21290, partial [Cyclobacteriaceae bacterium]